MAASITVTSNPDPAELQSLGVKSWPTWGCGVSTFPWTYGEYLQISGHRDFGLLTKGTCCHPARTMTLLETYICPP